MTFPMMIMVKSLQSRPGLVTGFFRIDIFNENFTGMGDKYESSTTLGLGSISQTSHTKINKNYYVVRNAGCAHSRYTLKLSLIFHDLINELIDRANIKRLMNLQ